MIAEWMPWVKLGAELLPEVIGWIVELANGGDADPVGTVRREIADRRGEIAANRAARDAQLREKHKARTERQDEPTREVPLAPTVLGRVPLRQPLVPTQTAPSIDFGDDDGGG